MSDRHQEWSNVIIPAGTGSIASEISNSLDQKFAVQLMSYLIRGLDPRRNYEAKVLARNRFGWSPVSEPFTFQTSDESMYLSL